jgi:hypothetical protein
VETPTVLYPAINLATFDVPVKQGAGQGVSPTLATVLANHTCLVSINRFERKKDVGLALRSFALLRNQLPPADFSDLRLVLPYPRKSKAESCRCPREVQSLMLPDICAGSCGGLRPESAREY